MPCVTGFSFARLNPPVTLSPSQSVAFDVTFAPSTAGTPWAQTAGYWEGRAKEQRVLSARPRKSTKCVRNFVSALVRFRSGVRTISGLPTVGHVDNGTSRTIACASALLRLERIERTALTGMHQIQGQRVSVLSTNCCKNPSMCLNGLAGILQLF
jgi:hypothetical protein